MVGAESDSPPKRSTLVLPNLYASLQSSQRHFCRSAHQKRQPFVLPLWLGGGVGFQRKACAIEAAIMPMQTSAARKRQLQANLPL